MWTVNVDIKIKKNIGVNVEVTHFEKKKLYILIYYFLSFSIIYDLMGKWTRTFYALNYPINKSGPYIYVSCDDVSRNPNSRK